MYKVTLKDGILKGFIFSLVSMLAILSYAQYLAPIANFNWIHIKKCWS